MAQTSIFLGNDDKYVKVAADDQIYINVPNADTSGTSQLWTFGADGSLTLPIGVSIDEYYGSHFPRIVADTGKAFSVQGQGSTGSVALQWIETESTSSRIAQVGLNKLNGVAAVTLTAGTSTNDMKVWRFDETGSTTFPDSTVQTTAYPGVLVPADGDGVSGNANMVFYAGTDWYNTSKVTINPTSSMLTLNGNSGTGGITFPDATVQTTAWTGTVNSTTASTSTTTGALVIAGGVGVGGGMFVGGTITATSVTSVATAGTTSTTAAALGYIGMPQNSTASSYTLVAGDQGKHIYISATGQTITIPANTAVAFPIGTSIAFIAGPSATTVSIAITTDTMYLAGTGTTGTRTLAAHGMATAVKVAAATWYINGVGLT
jgi:hypothetical protein